MKITYERNCYIKITHFSKFSGQMIYYFILVILFVLSSGFLIIFLAVGGQINYR